MIDLSELDEANWPEVHDDQWLVVSHGDKIAPFTIRSKKFMDGAVLAGHVRENMAANYPRFYDRPDILKIKGEPLALCAGGPSLNQTIDRVKAFKHVMVAGSAHDHVVQRGIEPTYAVVLDGLGTSVDYLSYPQKNCTYLFASQIDPNCYQRVSSVGAKINMWHYGNQLDEDVEINQPYNDEPTIGWACACTISAMQLSLLLGYQYVHLFGFDCAHQGDQHHAYPMPDWDPRPNLQPQWTPVGTDGTKVLTDFGLILQASQFMQLVRSPDGNFMHFTVHGSGLVAEMVRQGNNELKKRVALEP